MANLTKIELYGFSKRELECLYYFCQGKTCKQIARELSISPRTVETHVINIRMKAKCINKVELVGRFARYFLADIYEAS